MWQFNCTNTINRYSVTTFKINNILLLLLLLSLLLLLLLTVIRYRHGNHITTPIKYVFDVKYMKWVRDGGGGGMCGSLREWFRLVVNRLNVFGRPIAQSGYLRGNGGVDGRRLGWDGQHPRASNGSAQRQRWQDLRTWVLPTMLHTGW
jgi:hypothetical protein